MKESGRVVRCTGQESTLGSMAEDTKENMRMIKSKALVFTIGLMASVTRVNGIKANSTVKVKL